MFGGPFEGSGIFSGLGVSASYYDCPSDQYPDMVFRRVSMARPVGVTIIAILCGWYLAKPEVKAVFDLK